MLYTRVFLVAILTAGDMMYAEIGANGFLLFPKLTELGGQCDPLPKFPQVDPTAIVKMPTARACEGEEPDFFPQFLINEQNARAFKLSPPGTDLPLCEDNTKIVAEKIKGCSISKPNCNLSYVVFILSKINDKKVIVGQGIRLRNCNILTAYGVTQFGDSGLWVLYPNNTIKEVKCITKMRQYDGNIFAKEIYLVELVMEDGCCTDCGFEEPTILGYPDSPYEIGYLVEQSDCCSTNYSTLLILGLQVRIPNVPASIVIPDQPNDICIGYQGGVFINQKCEVVAIIAAKPAVAINTIYQLPLTKEIPTRCLMLADNALSQYIKGFY